MGTLALALGAMLALPPGVAWESSLPRALEVAKERGVPILLAFNMDGEVANDTAAEKTYRNPEFVKRSRDFVCLIASAAKHEMQWEGEGEERREVCKRFGAVTCDEHLKVEIDASDAYVGSETVIAPQHLLLSPQAFVFSRKAYEATKEELLRMMLLAEAAVRNRKLGIPEEEKARLARLIEGASDRHAERRRAAIDELGQSNTIEARDALIALLDPRRMDATRMEAIDALATPGNYDALSAILGRLKDENVQVVKHAIVGLEKLRLPGGVQPLLKLWKTKPKATIAREIPRALAACAPDDEQIVTLVRKACASKDTVVELSSLIALASLPGCDEHRALFQSKLSDRNGNVRALAVIGLAGIATREAVPLLEKTLANETNVEVRELLASAIAYLNAPNPKVLDALQARRSSFFPEDVDR